MRFFEHSKREKKVKWTPSSSKSSKSEKEIAMQNAEVEKLRIKTEAEVEMKRLQSEAEQKKRENDLYYAKKADAIFVIQDDNKTRVQIAQTEKEKEVQLAQINKSRELEKTEIQEDAAAKREQIQADRDLAIQKSNEEIRKAELEKEKLFITEQSRLMSEYMNYNFQIFKAKADLLLSKEESRRIKFEKSLMSAREEKKYLFECSKEAKGQEKINYLKQLSDVEKSIRELQDNNLREEELFRSEFELLEKKEEKQQREMLRIAPGNSSETKFLGNDEDL